MKIDHSAQKVNKTLACVQMIFVQPFNIVRAEENSDSNFNRHLSLLHTNGDCTLYSLTLEFSFGCLACLQTACDQERSNIRHFAHVLNSCTRKTERRLIFFIFFINVICAILLLLLSSYILPIYDSSSKARLWIAIERKRQLMKNLKKMRYNCGTVNTNTQIDRRHEHEVNHLKICITL